MENSMWRLPVVVNDHFLDPIGIVHEQCRKLQELTEGGIIAQIVEYSGSFISVGVYETIQLYHAFKEGLSNCTKSNECDATSPPKWKYKLGELDESQADTNETQRKKTLNYEFFITSSRTPKYKYRAFFLSVPPLGYPVTVILEQDIVDELGLQDEKYVCGSTVEFTEMLARILGSQRIGSILKGLLSFQS